MKIEKLSHEGRGIAHYEDGKTIFIRNALPDENVEFQITRKHRQFDESKATQILENSPLRVTPKCAVFGICGGCSLQHLDVHSQILAKQEWLAEKLFQTKITTEAWLTPLQAEVWGYRHKARLGVRFVKKRNEVLVGFREAESNFLTAMDRCEVLHPSVGTRLSEFKALLNTLSIREEIPQIEVAIDETKTVLIIRHLAPFTVEDLEKLKTLYDEFGWIISLQPKGLDSISQYYPTEKVKLEYQIEGQTIYFEPGDFTQVNFSLNRKMVTYALDLLNPKPTDTIVGLFCGLGNFSFPIAKRAQKVIAVEGDLPMVERARHNALKQDIHNIEFIASNLFELKEKEAFYGKVDKLFLDPPRAGAEAVCRSIEFWKPKRIVMFLVIPLHWCVTLAYSYMRRDISLRKLV